MSELENMTLLELRNFAKEQNIKRSWSLEQNTEEVLQGGTSLCRRFG